MVARQAPRLATWLAHRLVSPRRRESLVGDLLEQFDGGRSSSWYWRQVIMAISIADLGRRLASSVRVTSVAAVVSVGFVAILISASSVLAGRAVIWYVFFGPPLDVDAPRNGRVVAHIDWFARVPGDIARIRITETDTGLVLWDVKPISGRPGCWNHCWTLTLKTGDNPASFSAGPQEFRADIPRPAGSFSLTPGRPYLFEVWDHKGRLVTERFSL